MDGKNGTSKTVRSSLTCTTHSQTKEHIQKAPIQKHTFNRHTFDHPSSIPTFRQYPTIRTTFQSVTFELAVLHQGGKIRAWVGITTTVLNSIVAIRRFPPPTTSCRARSKLNRKLPCMWQVATAATAQSKGAATLLVVLLVTWVTEALGNTTVVAAPPISTSACNTTSFKADNVTSKEVSTTTVVVVVVDPFNVDCRVPSTWLTPSPCVTRVPVR